MNIPRLNRILKFEKREQDALAQRLSNQTAIMDRLELKLLQLQERRESLFDCELDDAIDLPASQNRISWSTMIMASEAKLNNQKQNVQLEMDKTIEQLYAQRSRIKAIESLLSSATATRTRDRQNREIIELADIVNQQFIGIRP